MPPWGRANPAAASSLVRGTASTEEAIVVEFRRRTLLPLDDVLGCLRETIPALSRSALHRCWSATASLGCRRTRRRRQSANASPRPPSAMFTSMSASGAWPRASSSCSWPSTGSRQCLEPKFTHLAFFAANTKMNGAAFLRDVVEAFPYALHTVLTDNGMAFADLPQNRNGPTRQYLGAPIFERVCQEHGIEHRLTTPYHPWTNGQAERMSRTVKAATVKVFHYPDLGALKAHVLAFVTAYNFAKHLKALRWRTPFQAICDAWTKGPSIFKINPHHLIPGPNS